MYSIFQTLFSVDVRGWLCETIAHASPFCVLSVYSCEACIDSVFTRPSGLCPVCGVALRRSQFRQQQFDDSHVEREVDVRKKILKE